MKKSSGLEGSFQSKYSLERRKSLIATSKRNDLLCILIEKKLNVIEKLIAYFQIYTLGDFQIFHGGMRFIFF